LSCIVKKSLTNGNLLCYADKQYSQRKTRIKPRPVWRNRRGDGQGADGTWVSTQRLTGRQPVGLSAFSNCVRVSFQEGNGENKIRSIHFFVLYLFARHWQPVCHRGFFGPRCSTGIASNRKTSLVHFYPGSTPERYLRPGN